MPQASNNPSGSRIDVVIHGRKRSVTSTLKRLNCGYNVFYKTLREFQGDHQKAVDHLVSEYGIRRKARSDKGGRHNYPENVKRNRKAAPAEPAAPAPLPQRFELSRHYNSEAHGEVDGVQLHVFYNEEKDQLSIEVKDTVEGYISGLPATASRVLADMIQKTLEA